MTWEQFSKMFHSRYVPLVDRDRLAQEYLDLRQGNKSVTEITKMYIEKAMFFTNFGASEQAQMTRYLSMLKTDIWQFVSTQCYGSLLDFHEDTRRREIDMELHTKEQRQDPV